MSDTSPTKRADARKNIAAIIEAATTCLAKDPDVSLNAIAEAAGVGRVTLYGHFPSRAALIAEVVDRAMQETDEALESVDLDGDPREALGRLLEATWHLTHRFGALVVAAQHSLPADQIHEAHQRPIVRMTKLLRTGRKQGSFRNDLPVDWEITTVQGIIHAASDSVHRGEITAAQAPSLIRRTVLAALTPPGEPVVD